MTTSLLRGVVEAETTAHNKAVAVVPVVSVLEPLWLLLLAPTTPLPLAVVARLEQPETVETATIQSLAP